MKYILRPIKSKFFKTILRDQHKDYPKSWWKGIPEEHLTKPFNKYDKEINKYGVKVGTTLQFWEKKNWIKKPIHMGGFNGIVIFIWVNVTRSR